MIEWKLTKREPDDEMVEQAWHATNYPRAGDPDWVVRTSWRAMHDAAPSEPTEAVKALVREIEKDRDAMSLFDEIHAALEAGQAWEDMSIAKKFQSYDVWYAYMQHRFANSLRGVMAMSDRLHALCPELFEDSNLQNLQNAPEKESHEKQGV